MKRIKGIFTSISWVSKCNSHQPLPSEESLQFLLAVRGTDPGCHTSFSSGKEITHTQQVLAPNNKYISTDLIKPVWKSRDVHCYLDIYLSCFEPLNFTVLRYASLCYASLRYTARLLHYLLKFLVIHIIARLFCAFGCFAPRARSPPAPLHVASITESDIIVSYYSGTTPYDPPHLYDLSFEAQTKAHAISYMKTPLLRPTTTFIVPSWFIFISMCGVVTLLIWPNFMAPYS